MKEGRGGGTQGRKPKKNKNVRSGKRYRVLLCPKFIKLHLGREHPGVSGEIRGQANGGGRTTPSKSKPKKPSRETNSPQKRAVSEKALPRCWGGGRVIVPSGQYAGKRVSQNGYWDL